MSSMPKSRPASSAPAPRSTRAGARLADQPLPELAEYAAINAKGGFSPPEAFNTSTANCWRGAATITISVCSCASRAAPR